MEWTTILETPYLKYETSPKPDSSLVCLRRTSSSTNHGRKVTIVEEVDTRLQDVPIETWKDFQLPREDSEWRFCASKTDTLFSVVFKLGSLTLLGALHTPWWRVFLDDTELGRGETWQVAVRDARLALVSLDDRLSLSL